MHTVIAAILHISYESIIRKNKAIKGITYGAWESEDGYLGSYRGEK